MVSQKYCKLILLIFVIIPILSFTACAAEESVTVTTYYPSPYGVYGEMRLYPKASGSSPCQEGTMYYNQGNHTVMVCGSGNAWQTLGGGGYWAASGSNPNDIHNTNSGRVGIGTSTMMGFLSLARETYVNDAYISFDTRIGTDGTVKRWGEVFASQQTDITDNINGGGMTDNSARNGWGISFGDNLDAFQIRRVKATGGVGTSGVLFTIINNGNVGIGTTGPSVPLHIASSASGAIRIADGTQAAGRVLTSDANGVGTWQPAAGAGGMSNIRVFTASGTFTVPSGITKLWVEVYGGGGGGGGSRGGSMVDINHCSPGGGGGGAGGVSMGFMSVSPGQNIAVTVGAAGVSNGCNAGGSGGTSSFLTLSATGGQGGSSGSSNWNRGGSGGVGSGGSINLRGSSGERGLTMLYGYNGAISDCNVVGGAGGSNNRGIGGGGNIGEFGDVFGGGGAGNHYFCCMSCNGGGAGGSGGVIIWY